MLIGILWELNPDKIGEVMEGYKRNEFQTPEGLKIVGKWLYNGTKCIEVVEVEPQRNFLEHPLVSEYTSQFDEYGSYTVVELTDARDVIPELVF